METYLFENKNILVTGASGGLGSAIVRRLAKKRANIVITSRSMPALAELIAELPDSARITPIAADLSNPGEAIRLVQKALEALGHIDTLFNIAGVGYFALMEETTEENIRHLFEVNTFSPLMLIKGLAPQMKTRAAGRIINIVSSAGRIPIPTVGVYGGSKSALAAMANAMRLEMAPAGIDIINIYPGTADTSFEENTLREEERPGLCPEDHCGMPRFEIADQILEAATGLPGEVWLERPGKWLSIAAIAWPKHVERRLAPIRNKVIETVSLKKKRWRLLQVESSLACNLRCIMCPWRQVSREAENHGIMSPHVWESIRPHLKDVRSIDFTGGGEPLLQPQLVKWISEATSAGCETGILTNGFFLKREMAQKLIQAGLDWICVSMDGATAEVYETIRIGSDFKRVCENLSNIAEMRLGKIPKTMINFVLMPINFHQIEDMVRLAKHLGVDQINFKQCDVIRGEHGREHGLYEAKETKEVRRLKRELAKARKVAKRLKIKTTAFDFTPQELPVCEQDPRDELFIRYDGTVGPCINLAIGGQTTFLGKDVNMASVHYGRIPDDQLMDIWESDTCQFYRNRFQERVTAHENTIVKSLVGGASSNRYKVLERARESMLEAPPGCQVCHYLYGI